MRPRQILCRIKRLLADRRGVSSLVFAGSTFALVGALALVTDMSAWYMIQRAAQNAADAGAAAGAQQSANITTTARDVTGRNGFTHGQGGIVVAVNETYASGGVEVVVRAPQPPGLARVLGVASPTIAARAVARMTAAADICGLALGGGLTVSGGANLALDATGCSLASNKTGERSININGQPNLTANSLVAAGECSQCAGMPGVPMVKAYVPLITNSFTRLHSQTFSKTGCRSSIPSSGTIPAGSYCFSNRSGSLPVVFPNGTNVTLGPGLHVIWNGDFRVEVGATVRCTGCTIVLTGDTPSTVGIVDIRLNANSGSLNLTAPTLPAGSTATTWSGILFYRDANAASRDITIGGNSNIQLQGVMYFPTSTVAYNGNATSEGCTLVVAHTLTFSGSASVRNCVTNFGVTPPGSRTLEFRE